MGILNRMAAASEARATWTAGPHPRDPALADILGFGRPTAAGVSVTPRDYRRCPEADACVTLIEDTVATLPLDLYERKGEGSRERAPDHPLHVVLHERPNDWQTSAQFRQMLEGFVEGWGNGYAEVITRRDQIVALEPMHPDHVYPFRTGKGTVAYRYSPSTGGVRTLLAGEVLHLKDHPFEDDLIRGQSKVRRHADLLGRAIATADYIARFFSNGALPKAFLVPVQGTTLTDDQRKELRKQYEERHGGPENAHRVGILPAQLDIKTFGGDHDKAEMVDSYKLATRQIGSVFGVPLHLIGEMANTVGAGAGGTSIEQQSIGFLTYHMRPKLVGWEQALNTTLMSRDMGRRFYFEFNVDALLRGDFASRMQGYALMIQWGLATANEIRRQMNLPPVTGGDERLSPLNMVPATLLVDVLMKKISGAGAPANENDKKNAADVATRGLVEFIAAYLDHGREQLVKAA